MRPRCSSSGMAGTKSSSPKVIIVYNNKQSLLCWKLVMSLTICSEVLLASPWIYPLFVRPVSELPPELLQNEDCALFCFTIRVTTRPFHSHQQQSHHILVSHRCTWPLRSLITHSETADDS